jgi:hypothetical protein
MVMQDDTNEPIEAPVSSEVMCQLDLVMRPRGTGRTALMLSAAIAAAGEEAHVMVVGANLGHTLELQRRFLEITGAKAQKRAGRVVHEGTHYHFTTVGAEQRESAGISGVRFIDHHAVRCELERLCKARI